MNKDIDICNSTIFLRVDFNVPLSKGMIFDTKRIDDVIPTILDFLLKKNKIVIASHLGRPNGFDSSLSLKIVFNYLTEKLNNYKISFLEKINDQYIDFVQNQLNFGEILMLENLRFYNEEEKCDENFMRLLSTPIDFYCNEAFSCSHRAHASIMVAKFFDKNHKSLGYLFQKEIDAINNFLKNKNGKSIAIIGGSKISSKIHLLKSLQKKVDFIFVIGAMANTLLKFNQCEIGKSFIENNCDEIIKNFFNTSEKNQCKIILPNDFVVTNDIKNSTYIKNTSIVESDDIIVDIGNNSIKNLEKILEECKNVLWNGPAGIFEVKPFGDGTLKIANVIADLTCNNKINSIVGGGDTIAAIHDKNLLSKFTHVSTAGGAFLEYIEQDEKLIGLSAFLENEA
jgi:phosphoglycerate kinase